MCISIIFAPVIKDEEKDRFRSRIEELGWVYGYGIGMNRENLLPAARDSVMKTLNNPALVFEVHDLAEVHCACDIDQDIRNGSKSAKPSKFFDFIKEILEHRGLAALSVLFFQEQLPEPNNIRRHSGTYREFVNLLNRWNTWQVEGFEPTRQAYFIADESPLLFVFTLFPVDYNSN